MPEFLVAAQIWIARQAHLFCCRETLCLQSSRAGRLFQTVLDHSLLASSVLTKRTLRYAITGP